MGPVRRTTAAAYTGALLDHSSIDGSCYPVAVVLVMYARDDAARRITVTTSGPLTLADVLANIDRQILEDTWTFGMLYNTGDADLPTQAQIDRIIAVVRAAAKRLGRRGPVAIVSRSATAMAAAREYSVVEHDVGSVGFFRHVEEAERWLESEVRTGGVGPHR
jgi:hypothetical protein